MVRTLGLWAVTVAFTIEGKLLILLQFKYGVGEVTIQLPPGGAGKTDHILTEQEIIDQSRAVFTDETGFGKGVWRLLRRVNVDDNKYRNEYDDGPLQAHLLWAEGVEKVEEPKPRSTDLYELIEVDPSEFQELLDSEFLVEISARLCVFEAFLAKGILKFS